MFNSLLKNILFTSVLYATNLFAIDCSAIKSVEDLEEMKLGLKQPYQYLSPEQKLNQIKPFKSRFDKLLKELKEKVKENKIDLTCLYENVPELKQDLANLSVKHLTLLYENKNITQNSSDRNCNENVEVAAFSSIIWDIHYFLKNDIDKNELFQICKEQLKLGHDELKTCVEILDEGGHLELGSSQGMGLAVSDNEYYKNNSFFTDPKLLPDPIKNSKTLALINTLDTKNIQFDNVQKEINQIKLDLEKNYTNVKLVSFSESGIAEKKNGPSNRMVISYDDKNCTYTYVTGEKKLIGHGLIGRHIHCWNDPQTGKKLDEPIQFLMDFKINNNDEIENRTMTEKCINCHTRGPILFMSQEVNYGKKTDVDEINKKLRELPVAKWVTWDQQQKNYIDAFNIARKKSNEVFGPMFKYDDPKVEQRIIEVIPEDAHLYGLDQKKIVKTIKNSASCSECHNPNYLGQLTKNEGFSHIHLKSYIISDEFNKDHNRFIKGEFTPEQKNFLNHVLMNYLGIEYDNNNNINTFNYHDKLINSNWHRTARTAVHTAEVFTCPKISDIKKSFFENDQLIQILKNAADTYPDTKGDLSLLCLDPNKLKIYNAIDQMNSYFMPDWNKDNPFQSNKIICKDNGNYHYPVTGLPGCTGTCAPYETTLKFNSKGDFMGFTNEDCVSCQFALKKYYPQHNDSHKELSDKEKQLLENYFKQTMKNNPDKFLASNDYFVDAYSGATLNDSFPFSGAGLMISDLGKYISTSSLYIKNMLKDSCKPKE